jgi:hypothetical protein
MAEGRTGNKLDSSALKLPWLHNRLAECFRRRDDSGNHINHNTVARPFPPSTCHPNYARKLVSAFTQFLCCRCMSCSHLLWITYTQGPTHRFLHSTSTSKLLPNLLKRQVYMRVDTSTSHCCTFERDSLTQALTQMPVYSAATYL